VPPERVLILLGGMDITLDTVRPWLDEATHIYAADGAANRLFENGIPPSAVIGDMDSTDAKWRTAKVEWVEIRDQQATDCDKLLAWVGQRHPNAPIWATGVEGDRLDHVLSNLQSMAKSGMDLKLILRDGMGIFIAQDRGASISAIPGQVISIIPLTECSGVRASGLKWTPGSDLGPTGALSISNLASATSVQVDLDSGNALVIIQTDSGVPRWNGI
jgi:thiamine pyrophosphokinase